MSAGRILRKIFSASWSAVDGLRKVLHLLLLLLVVSLIISALAPSVPPVPGSAALLIQPAGRFVEQLAGDPFDRARAELMGNVESQTLVQDVIDGLKFAKEDKRITAVVLDLSAVPGGGLSKLKRISVAIDDFRSSGKLVIANADYYSQGSYYLASHADEVYMHPEGILVLSGFGAYQNYFKEAIDVLRIDWNIFRVGTYKSAIEPYTRNDMSADDKEAIGAVLQQLWDQYKIDIETARDLDPGTIDGVLESLVANVRSANGNLASLALDNGFVDAFMTRDEFQARMVEIAGNNDDETSYSAARLDDYLQQMRLLKGDKPSEENVAVVVAAGVIMNGSQSPGMIGGDSTARLLRQARQDDSVKAVVLRVDSPGGSSFASEVIRQEVDAIKAAGKPVVVSMGSVAASGGYWVSMTADRIFATPYTITVSIGIFGMFTTYQRSLGALGIYTDGLGTTPWAGQLRPDREMSEDMKTVFQLSIESGYDQFISNVADGRGLEKDFVDSIAQGRIWTGADAMEIGLIDEFGNIDEAVAAAAELADLEPDTFGKKYFEQKLDPAEQFLLDLMGGVKAWGVDPASFGQSRPAIERVARALEDTLLPLTQFNDPKGMYSHCFCEFE